MFGCPAYAHVKDDKLGPKAKKCIFLGYASGVKGYRLWCVDPKSPRFLTSKDVTFDESAMLRRGKESGVVDRDLEVSKQVELEVKTPETVREDSTVQSEQEEVQETPEETTSEIWIC